MTAALGQEARLLALRCQPAEVQGGATIPPHLQFWGVDSGGWAVRGRARRELAGWAEPGHRANQCRGTGSRTIRARRGLGRGVARVVGSQPGTPL